MGGWGGGGQKGAGFTPNTMTIIQGRMVHLRGGRLWTNVFVHLVSDLKGEKDKQGQKQDCNHNSNNNA